MTSESENWRSIAAALGVGVISPVDLAVNGASVRFTAHLPQFGTPAGMIVDPDWSKLEPLTGALLDAGYGFSCCSIEGSTPDGVMNILRDWGWSRSPEQPPDWL